MTNQEASKVIKDGLEDMSLDYIDIEQYEALTMAIKALEQEPSGDLISRQASISKIKELFSLGDCYCDEYSIVGTLNGMPPVTLPPKTGHWISDVFVDECSVCGEQTLFFEDQQKNFCPNCGAKMVEPQESEE